MRRRRATSCVQQELAATLGGLARSGAAGFYGGEVARALVDSVNSAGGVWQLADLAEYRVVERAPVRFQYRGATITAAALPSAGGIALAQALNMLERFAPADARAPASAHLVIEAMRRAFHDRTRFLGDPDFVTVPVDRLVSKDYARRRASNIDPAHATPSDCAGRGARRARGEFQYHAPVGDRRGGQPRRGDAHHQLAVRLGHRCGNDRRAAQQRDGRLLLRLRDVPNSYRLHGSNANAVAPGKRPLSSMTPAFVEDGKGVLVLGAPGGPRIVSQVLLGDTRLPGNAAGESRSGAHRAGAALSPSMVAGPGRGRAGGLSAGVARRAGGQGPSPAGGGAAWGNMQLVFKSKATGVAQAASDPRGLDVGWY